MFASPLRWRICHGVRRRAMASPKAARPEQVPQHRSHSTAASAGSFSFYEVALSARPREPSRFAIKPRERRETGAEDMFRSRLDQIINLKHELVKLSKTKSWSAIE